MVNDGIDAYGVNCPQGTKAVITLTCVTLNTTHNDWNTFNRWRAPKGPRPSQCRTSPHFLVLPSPTHRPCKTDRPVPSCPPRGSGDVLKDPRKPGPDPKERQRETVTAGSRAYFNSYALGGCNLIASAPCPSLCHQRPTAGLPQPAGPEVPIPKALPSDGQRLGMCVWVG